MKAHPSDDFYAREADRIARGPQLYGGDAAVASLRCFRGYHRDARWATVQRAGIDRWYTDTMMRVEAIALRVGTVGSGYTKTADIATEARCSRGYVSKMLTRFESWGVIGVIRTRGRNGKLFIFARSVGDRLDRYMAEAKRRLHEANVTRWARRIVRGLNVSSLFPRKGKGMDHVPEDVDVSNAYMEETFSGFAREVIHERARMAMEDPAGEAEAVAPLTQERAWELYSKTWPQERPKGAYTGQDLADALGVTGRPKGSIKCPAHEDKRASLSFRWNGDKFLLHCFAGCTFDEIRRAVL